MCARYTLRSMWVSAPEEAHALLAAERVVPISVAHSASNDVVPPGAWGRVEYGEACHSATHSVT